jgi:hypothetical protein
MNNINFGLLKTNKNIVSVLELVLILGFACVPLFSNFPYRINIFLSWEGAYRLYLGHIPFKDFGLPMGFGYWILPALFFKIFGPYLITLIKAQVFINIMSGLAFRSILKSFEVNERLRLAAVLLFIISYSFFNFWPWYNHSVIVFELTGLAFLLKFIFRTDNHFKYYLILIAASFFLFLAVFTKQDGGALGFLVAFFITLYHSIVKKKIKDSIWFVGTFIIMGAVFIIPFVQYDFGYWFNYGQAPHNSRISLFDFLDAGLGGSKWEKFYLSGLILILIARAKNIKQFFFNEKEFMFFLFTLGIIVEALIFQVTSYTPPDNNIFFHSFAIVYFLSLIDFEKYFNSWPKIMVVCASILLWWSGVYWKYIERTLTRIIPDFNQVDEDVISRNTYAVNSDAASMLSREKWTYSDVEEFKGVYMPESTVEGIDRFLNLPQVNSDAKILNMTELTPLAATVGYELEKGKPLWYHKGVGIFQEQVDEYIHEIEQEKYDVVLFEVIPNLNNFYPMDVYESLHINYKKVDEFLAPRRPTDATIEVFVKK